MNFNLPLTLRVTSIITLLLGIAMLPSVFVAILYEERYSGFGLFLISIVCIAVGMFFMKQTGSSKLKIKNSEGYFITLLCWGLVCIIGALPFLFSSNGYTFVDSFFESTSGFTTTGCGVINIDNMPKSLLFWKATTHWLGGMGILILTVSIFSFLGISGQSMAAAEAPGPTLQKTSTRITDTGKFLYATYILFSIVEFILLMLSGMGPYNALTNTMSSISTGGLMITDDNAMLFEDTYVRLVVLIFTLLSSINFMIYFFIRNKEWKKVFKNIELRGYLGIISVSSIIIAVSLVISGEYSSIYQAFKDGLCQAVSINSTSGYYVCNYNTWPTIAKVVLLIEMFIGSCAASTGGSIKVIRVLVLYQLVKRGIYRRIHTRSVRPIVIGDSVISARNVSSITTFILMYFAVYFFSCLFLSIDNLSMETILSTVIGAFSNCGCSFGLIGATGDYSIYSPICRLFIAFLMLAGRLEMYAIIFLFTKSFWKPDKANY